MAGYLGAIPVPQATQNRESFTASANQTSFATAGYTVGFVDAFLNGVRLNTADFTATNGSDIVLASGAAVNDILDVISYATFEVNSQTFTGTTTMTDVVAASLDISGNIDIDGVTNLDVVNIAGAVSVGVNDTGYDVKFFGATADAFMLWDQSEDDLILGGAAGLSVNSAALVTGVLTTTAKAVSNGGIGMPDNAKLTFGGTGDGDLQIYHDGSNSYVDDAGTGRLILRGNDRVMIQKYTGEDMISCLVDGAVNIYHNNAKKIETTATGVAITGGFTATTGSTIVVAGSSADIATFGLSGNTNNPSLIVKGHATNQVLTFRGGSNTSTYPAIAFDMGTSGEAVRILANGNLLVGMASDSVTGTGAGFIKNGISHIYAGDFTADTGGPPLMVGRGTNDGPIIEFNRSGTTGGGINIDGGSLVIGGGDVGIGFYQAANSIVPYNQSTNQARGDLIDIGINSIRWRDLYLSGNVKPDAGKGIDFAATGGPTSGSDSSELFNDYEEGTWTPAISGSSGKNITDTNYARYIKIGKQVHFQAYIVMDGTGNSVAFRLGGLPYAPPSNGYSVVACDINRVAHGGVYGRVASSSQILDFYFFSGSINSDRSVLLGNDLGTGYFICSGTYIAN